jgi:N-methylhydantoinase A
VRYVVGIDVGGTFTDCVLVDEQGRVFTDKSFTVPESPGEGMVKALGNVTESQGLAVDTVLADSRTVAIGTTAITNKLITRGGAKVGLITTKGHEDAIFIGRIMAKTDGLADAEKSDMLAWGKPEPLVPRPLVKGITERIDYKGAVLVALNEKETVRAVAELLEAGCEAIAVSLLWSFINPAHERWIKEHIETKYPSIYVATGSAVAPVVGEFERTNATILSAHLGALARQQMDVMKSLLATRGLKRPFLVMQSNGGCMWAEEVSAQPLNLIASGPAGGIMGAAKLGERMGYDNIIATDMGGTSFDVGVITAGSPILSDVAVHGRIRMALPHVEVVSIGAGGGSIAWVDEATGLLHVGPRSAGSVPGPVAYGQGGFEPTTTDADVVLGRIDPEVFFKGRQRLDGAKAEAAIRTRIAEPLGIDVHAAAQGIIDIVDSRMGDLIRKLTIERGIDPRDFVLFAYGGAGPTHVGAFAREIGLQMAVVSPHASVFSALGIAASDIVRVYSHSQPLRMPFDLLQVNTTFARLERQAADELRQREVGTGGAMPSRLLEMRFRHQIHQLKVPAPGGELRAKDMDAVTQRFTALYEQSFGHGTAVTESEVEIMTFHVVATARTVPVMLKEMPMQGPDSRAAAIGDRRVYFDGAFVDTPIYDMGRLTPGNTFSGPAIVECPNSTLIVHAGQHVSVDTFGNVVIRFGTSS